MNIEEIREEIERLESAETNWTNIQKLSWLYTVRSNLSRTWDPESAAEIMPQFDGEFGEVVAGRSIEKVMSVISEHMSVIKVLHPKEYQSVIERIRG